MTKKHIIKFGYRNYAVDSISTATQAIALLSKLTLVEKVYNEDYTESYWKPEEERENDISLETNQKFLEPPKPKKEKPLALPKPKRGSIMCICEKSFVAPRETCAHCGRSFDESHRRTHGADRTGGETLKLD